VKKIRIYTDGACSGNQEKENIGGWGTILEYNENQKELSGGEINTTNNIMELTAVIEGLKSLKSFDLDIKIFSDSAYIVNCFNEKWYSKWLINGWMTSKKTPVENKDLWMQLIDLVNKFEKLKFYKIKGHLKTSGAEFNKWYKKYTDVSEKVSEDEFKHIVKMNNRADQLANIEMDKIRKHRTL